MRKDERGQSIVETALLLPIFFLLIAGILDFGRVLYSYAHLQMAAQETVRLAGLGENDQNISTFAHQYVHLGDTSKLQITTSPIDTKRHSGDYVTVSLTYPYKFFTPLISKLFPSSFKIQTSSTIRVE
ncbi:MAG TPA: TadE/TadG family type IV pilus assembly protein [Neobacillus sp.]|jgi:Flp pilus assembly protein TadG